MTTAFHSFWISNRTPREAAGTGLRGATPALRWSKPFADVKEARAHAKRQVEEGLATLSFVVAFTAHGAGRVVRVYPEPARKVIDHYLQLVDAVRDGPPPA